MFAKAISVGDVTREDRLQFGSQAAEEGIRSTLSARLPCTLGTLGMIRAYSTEFNRTTQDDITFLTAIANQGSLAIENAMAFQTLGQLDEMKSKFVLIITHELRSPVSVVRSLLRTITNGYAGTLFDQQVEIVARALRRADFLQTLIDDLLDLASGKSALNAAVEWMDVSLVEAVERVIKRFELPAQEKQIELKWQCEAADEPIMVSATTDGIDRILNNLVSNGVKYTPVGGTVTVTLRRAGGVRAFQGDGHWHRHP